MAPLNLPQIDGLDVHQVASLVFCRGYKQYLDMIKSYRDGVCVFCVLGPKNVVLQEVMGWRMWENPFPLKHTKLHLVMASERHIAPGAEILEEDFLAMGKLYRWAEKAYRFTGGGFAMRFGSPLESAGTVLHLHANIIVPDQSGVVEVTLAKEPVKIEEQVARMWVFEKMRTGVKQDDLTAEEQALIRDRMLFVRFLARRVYAMGFFCLWFYEHDFDSLAF